MIKVKTFLDASLRHISWFRSSREAKKRTTQSRMYVWVNDIFSFLSFLFFGCSPITGFIFRIGSCSTSLFFFSIRVVSPIPLPLYWDIYIYIYTYTHTQQQHKKEGKKQSVFQIYCRPRFDRAIGQRENSLRMISLELKIGNVAGRAQPWDPKILNK